MCKLKSLYLTFISSMIISSLIGKLVKGNQFSCQNSIIQLLTNSSSCLQRFYGDGKMVCVCSENKCDPLGKTIDPSLNQVIVYESNKAGLRFQSTIIDEKLSQSCEHQSSLKSFTINVNIEKKYQKIIGFGGAFTDSTGINILSLPEQLGNQIIRDYFSSEGLGYTVARVPIGGSDFSTRPYTYDDNSPNDFELKHFRMADEDINYKIPLIKKALKLSPNLKLFGSAWSSPAWMKTSDSIWKKGSLKGDPKGRYYKTWADYYVKFLDAYKEENIKFWGLTTGNEPVHGLLFSLFNNLAFTPSTQRDFIKYDLGPALKEAGYWPEIKIMIMDDQLPVAPFWIPTILRDKHAAQYVSGIAYHWYATNYLARLSQDMLAGWYPDFFWLSTEACEGYRLKFDPEKVILGSWERAESYANDIIADLNHQTSGWVDWNMALDLTGGPNWANNHVDSPIIVNASAKEYYRQPMYYALAHFTKFLSPNSIRIETSGSYGGVDHTAFLTPNNTIVLIALNRNNYSINLKVSGLSQQVSCILSPNSITTIVTSNSKSFELDNEVV